MSRPIAEDWFHRLKAATRDLVKACGGVERAGRIALVSKTEVSRWQSAGDPDLISIPAALALEAECGLSPVTAAMAELGGRRLAEPEAALSVAAMLGRHAEVALSAADLMAAVAAAAADGWLSPAEAEIVDRAAGAVARTLEPLRHGLAAAKAAGGLEIVEGGRR